MEGREASRMEYTGDFSLPSRIRGISGKIRSIMGTIAAIAWICRGFRYQIGYDDSAGWKFVTRFG